MKEINLGDSSMASIEAIINQAETWKQQEIGKVVAILKEGAGWDKDSPCNIDLKEKKLIQMDIPKEV